jgi:copper chaperone CopZ
MGQVISINIGGLTCDGCSGKVKKTMENISGVISAEVSHESGVAVIEHEGVSKEVLISSIKSTGYTIDGKGEDFHWRDGSVWKQSAHNTKWCLVGCSIGDFGTIAAFQSIPYLDALGWSAMSIMLLAMFNGIMTSIALETFILIKQMGGIREAFRVAIGMSLISMIAMEASMNATDLLIMGEPTLTWWIIPIMLFVGFITPWPYNYWRLKKYGVACH